MKMNKLELYVDFSGKEGKWVSTLLDTGVLMGIEFEQVEFDIIRFTGKTNYQLKIFRQLIEMSDGGTIVE